MATKERNQNLVIGDIVRLRLFVLNGNAYVNLHSIDAINIYYIDKTNISETNLDGRTFFTTLSLADLVNDEDGKYYIDLELESPSYVIGGYIDEWVVTYSDTEIVDSTIENRFTVYPNLWVTDSKPLIYDFSFKMHPNRITKDSVKYLTVEIAPNVLKGTTIQKYYENLIISSDITLTMIQRCGRCLPQETDLRTVLEDEEMTFKDGNTGYYLLDTTEMDCGIYDVVFTLNFGDTVHISPKSQLEIYS